ncbi:hypothetical protein GWK47_017277 [Chionoecetes opilio]|uniref:G protein-coupled receptor n=1 Tax=Chionoecetes opilio TaxID=41210 RepID=A0A8J4XRX6_CHIOP|nr:hypothetical protein GWK47_017277 [Chionoecetes opilio]
MCLLVMPFMAHVWISKIHCNTHIPRALIRAMIVIYIILTKMEILYITIMAFVRTLAVWSSTKRQVKMFTAVALTVGIAIYSTAMTTLLLGSLLGGMMDNRLGTVLVNVYNYVHFLAPVVLTIACYFSMMFVVRRNKRRLTSTLRNASRGQVMDQATRAMLPVFISNLFFVLPHSTYHVLPLDFDTLTYIIVTSVNEVGEQFRHSRVPPSIPPPSVSSSGTQARAPPSIPPSAVPALKGASLHPSSLRQQFRHSRAPPSIPPPSVSSSGTQARVPPSIPPSAVPALKGASLHLSSLRQQFRHSRAPPSIPPPSVSSSGTQSRAPPSIPPSAVPALKGGLPPSLLPPSAVPALKGASLHPSSLLSSSGAQARAPPSIPPSAVPALKGASLLPPSAVPALKGVSLHPSSLRQQFRHSS